MSTGGDVSVANVYDSNGQRLTPAWGIDIQDTGYVDITEYLAEGCYVEVNTGD